MPDETDDIDNDADEFLEDRQNDSKNAKEAGQNLGDAYESGEQSKKDAEDGDQNTADKAKNVSDGAGDALDSTGKALEALGIDDPGFGDLADGLDSFTDEAFGPGAPESLPPVDYALYFGEEGTLDKLGQGALSDGMGIADGLVGQATDAMGVSDYVGSDAVSSIGGKHDPFVDEEALKNEQSQWKLAQVRWTEGLNDLFRCEMILRAFETRNPLLEAEYGAEESGGSLVDQITGPVKNAMALGEAVVGAVSGAVDTVEGIFDDPLGSASSLISDALSGDEGGPGPEDPVYINIPIDPAVFLGQTCSVRVTRAMDGNTYSDRWLTGVVVAMDDLGGYRGPPAGQDDQEEARFIRVVVMPSLYRLGLRKDCRVFEDMSALEIIREVFRVAGVYGFLPDLPGVGAVTDFASDLVGDIPIVGGVAAGALSGQFIHVLPPADTTEDEWTPKRELCVQYDETDLSFVRRLLEEEGIHFTFEHRRGFERLVLVHDPAQLDEAVSVDGRAVPFFWPHWKDAPLVETLREIGERRTMRTGTITLRDFNFSNGQLRPTTLDATERLKAPETTSAVSYEYPGRLQYQYLGDDAIHYRDYQPGTKDRDVAALRLEEELTKARDVRLRSDLISAEAGKTIQMRGYLFHDVDPAKFGDRADILVVRKMRVFGNVSDPDGVAGPNAPDLGEVEDKYQAEIIASWIDLDYPERTPIRPERRTRKPRILGIQTATVVDDDGSHSEDEEVHIDDLTLCRVRVRFHWDRRGEMPLGIDLPLVDLGKTSWVRVAQAWAGADFGVHFVPRIGTEVIVAFENGDPDRPVVVGSLYDGEHPVPVENPEQSTIHTHTMPWDDDEGVTSYLRFDDTPTGDEEKVELKAGRYLVEEVRQSRSTTVGNDHKIEVVRHQSELVEGQHRVEVTEKNRKKIVRLDQDVIVKRNRTRSVGESEEVIVELNREEVISGVETREIGGKRQLILHGERFTTIGEEGDALPPVSDKHETKGNKTDTIEGDLIVRADELAVGPSGAGADSSSSGLAVGEDEESGHAIVAQAEQGKLALRAKEQVTVKSEEAEVDINGEQVLVIECPGQVVTMDANGISLTSDARVQIAADAGHIAVKPDMIDMTALGERNAMAIVRAPVVRMSGKRVIITMTNDIDLTAAATEMK